MENDQFEIKTLMMSDFFGESEVLRIPDFSYYGDIYASSKKDVKIIFIRYPVFRSIFLYELEEMSERLRERHKQIQYTLCQKHKIHPRSFDKIRP